MCYEYRKSVPDSHGAYEGAGTKQFDLTGQKPGLYILVVPAGTAIRTEVFQLK
jgi:hypothetical protein